MTELEHLKAAIHPDEILLVADGMTGQDAVKIAQGFDQRLHVTGVILTKIDGDARGGAALSIYGVTKKPIKYIGVGEKVDALEEFHPDRMAGRILQQGDIVVARREGAGRVRRRRSEAAREEGPQGRDGPRGLPHRHEADRAARPAGGPAQDAPGREHEDAQAGEGADPKRMRHLEAIVLSMTIEERKKPEMMNGSRRARVAKGGGRPISEVNRLLEQFREMQKMMKKASRIFRVVGGSSGLICLVGCDRVLRSLVPGLWSHGERRSSAVTLRPVTRDL